MSDLEGQVKPLLEPLLGGERRGLDLAAQSTIALWGMKIAMVLQCVDAQSKAQYTPAECSQLRALSAIPVRTSAWLGACAQSSFIMTSRTHHSAGEAPETPRGFSTTLVFGHVALQYFTMRFTPPAPAATQVTVDVRKGPWEDATVRIWPPRPDSVAWPPRLGFNQEFGLDLLAERFEVTRPGAVKTQKLAV